MDWCTDVTHFVHYDPWVVPHQLLPSIAVVIGIDAVEVVALVYLWETIEMIIGCLSDRFHEANSETLSNALISDPFQAFMGIIVAKLIVHVTGMESPLVKSRPLAYLYSAFFILPGTAHIAGGSAVWLYMPMWFLCFFFLVYVTDYTVTVTFAVWYCLYVVTVIVGVFVLEETLNSFYAGLVAAGIVVFMVLLYGILNKSSRVSDSGSGRVEGSGVLYGRGVGV
jgi:hypothetical protein